MVLVGDTLSLCLSVHLSLGLEVECELPLLVEVGAAHLHCQPPITCAAAVQAQVAAHVPQLGVALNLLPFLSAVVFPAALHFDL